MNKPDLDTAQIIALLRDIARERHKNDPWSIMNLAADCISQLNTQLAKQRDQYIDIYLSMIGGFFEARAEEERLTNERDEARAEEERLTNERDEARAEVERIKDHLPAATKMIRPEPSRLEIAAMAMQGLLANDDLPTDVARLSLKHADALIKVSKGGAK
jgi:hypothetical protein